VHNIQSIHIQEILAMNARLAIPSRPEPRT